MGERMEKEKIIKAYLKEKEIPIEDPFTYADYTFPKEDNQGYCIFYDKKKKKMPNPPSKTRNMRRRAHNLRHKH